MDELGYVTPPGNLTALLQKTAEIGFEMGSEWRTGALLRALAASKPSGRFLELGTGTGIGTAWLLDGMDSHSSLTSIDVDTRAQSIARDSFSNDARLELVTGDALAFLSAQAPQSFDLVFADAMPGKYEGLDLALNVVKPGGFFVVDDLLPQANWPVGHAARVPQLLSALSLRQDFRLVPMAWASGVAIAVRVAH